MPIRQIVRRANAFDERSARRARAYLEQLQTELTRRLLNNIGSKWDIRHFEQARREIAQLMVELERQLGGDLVTVINRAGEIGASLADDALKGAVNLLGFPRLSLGFVQEAAQASAVLIRGITESIRAKIDMEIDRGIQGLQTGIETIQKISDVRGFTGIAFKSAIDRAESIFRTEASRIINMATIARYKDLDSQTEDDLLKYWLATNDSRTRDTHRQIWNETDPDLGGKPIAFEKNFVLSDGDKGFGPSAPTFAAENVINCRCRLLVLTKKKYIEKYG